MVREHTKDNFDIWNFEGVSLFSNKYFIGQEYLFPF